MKAPPRSMRPVRPCTPSTAAPGLRALTDASAAHVPLTVPLPSALPEAERQPLELPVPSQVGELLLVREAEAVAQGEAEAG